MKTQGKGNMDKLKGNAPVAIVSILFVMLLIIFQSIIPVDHSRRDYQAW